ncbi:hypothetical protein PHLH5_14110 [Pseudomonas sp. Cab53]|nr:hypothetical protein PHLH5_14110 [Pseudomonas sp. Cab53]
MGDLWSPVLHVPTELEARNFRDRSALLRLCGVIDMQFAALPHKLKLRQVNLTFLG